MELIDSRIRNRAYQAFRFLPFNSTFYLDVKYQGLTAESVFENRYRYCVMYSHWFEHSDSVENAFRFLIKIGILRREVDGQGLTSRIRLTPLGRQLLEINPRIPDQRSNLAEKMINCFYLKFQL